MKPACCSARWVVAAAGYRAKGLGAHQTTFVALKLAMGPDVAKLVNYFDRCRRKRNDLSYDMAGVVTDTEAARLLAEVDEFRKTVEDWIAQNHPRFS